MSLGLLGSEELEFFNKNGYLVVKSALSEVQTTTLQADIRRFIGDSLDQPRNKANILEDSESFLDLIDIPTVFPKVWGILGANIRINHTHYNFNPVEQPGQYQYFGWHRDGGAIHWDLKTKPPLMSIKVGFYLTDVTELNSGHTFVIPGSHLDDSLNSVSDPDEVLLKKAIPLDVEKGSAVLYHQRLIHSVHSPNYYADRYAVFIQWAYRWLASVDAFSVAKLCDRVSDPVRRQLLNLDSNLSHPDDPWNHPHGGSGRSGLYYPRAEEIPLNKLIQAHQESI